MEAHQLINNSIGCKPLPEWIKSLPRYQESAGLLESLYPGTRRATVEVAGVEWSADSHEPDPELSCHPSNDRLLYVRKVADGYSWRAALIVRAAVCYVDVGGTAASVCEAAKAAMAAEFRRLVIVDETWYASTWGAGIEWKCLRGDKVLTIRQHPAPSSAFEWSTRLEGIELFKGAGMSFEYINGDHLTGFAESLEDAVRAVDDAPAVLRAACRAYLALPAA